MITEGCYQETSIRLIFDSMSFPLGGQLGIFEFVIYFLSNLQIVLQVKTQPVRG